MDKHAIRVGSRVVVHPGRVVALPWHGVVERIDEPGHEDHRFRRLDVGVLVRPTMPGHGWSTVPVWLPYERVRVAVEA